MDAMAIPHKVNKHPTLNLFHALTFSNKNCDES